MANTIITDSTNRIKIYYNDSPNVKSGNKISLPKEGIEVKLNAGASVEITNGSYRQKFCILDSGNGKALIDKVNGETPTDLDDLFHKIDNLLG